MEIFAPSADLIVAPNPTRGPLGIVYSREAPGPTQLLVFDVTGRRITEVTREDGSGRNEREFEGLSRDLGSALSNGVYYARLRTDQEALPVRIVLRRSR